MKQYAKGGEIQCGSFSNINEAKLFIQENLHAEAAMNVQVIYRLYEYFDLLQEFTAADLDSLGQDDEQGSGGQSKSSTQTFKPTPFNTTPRPLGTPPKWLIDDEDKNEDDTNNN